MTVAARQSYVVDKYLSRWAEPVAQRISWRAGESWDLALVLPLFDESLAWLQAIPESAEISGRLLIVAVVNAGATAAKDAIERSRQLYGALRDLTPVASLDSDLHLVRYSDSVDILICDRVSQGRLLADGGVGQARKLGCDIALSAYASARLRSPWLATSDGDVLDFSAHLEAQGRVGDDASDGVLLLPFRHVVGDEDQLSSAHRFYELSLWHYVLGLASAGSPYAFHTIGSTLVIHAVSYAQVRGFPKRSGAEDFHMLNKLRKVGPIKSLDASQVPIRCRTSERVPFGTGRAVADLLLPGSIELAKLFYDPRTFRLLASLLSLFRDEAFAAPSLSLREALGPLAETADIVNQLERWGAGKARQSALQQSKSRAQFDRQWHTWFDGLKTLRLIHSMTAAGMPRVTLQDAAQGRLTLSHEANWDAMLASARRDWHAKGYAGLGAGALG